MKSISKKLQGYKTLLKTQNCASLSETLKTVITDQNMAAVATPSCFHANSRCTYHYTSWQNEAFFINTVRSRNIQIYSCYVKSQFELKF